MAERRGPGSHSRGDDPEGRDPARSGRPDDRVRVDDEREFPAEGTPGEDSELTENREGGAPETAGAGAAEPEDHEFHFDEASNHHGAADAAAGDEAAGIYGKDDTADVLTFRTRRENSGSESEKDTAADESLDDLAVLDEFADEPVDLSALQDDDALLDALGGADPDVKLASSEDEPDLETLLVAWRRDVDSAPIGDLVDMDTAVAAIEEGRRPRLRKRRHLVPVATAAAVLMIGFTGVGLAARDAMPGDALWGVAQVLYTDHARSAQAATAAQTELASASTNWDRGHRAEAQAALRRAHDQIQTVDAEHGLTSLQASYASLTRKFQRDEASWESPSASRSTTEPPSPSQPPAPPPPPPSQMPPPPPSSTSGSPTTSSTAPSETTSPPPSSGSSQPSSGSGSSSPPGGGLFPQSTTTR